MCLRPTKANKLPGLSTLVIGLSSFFQVSPGIMQILQIKIYFIIPTSKIKISRCSEFSKHYLDLIFSESASSYIKYFQTY